MMACQLYTVDEIKNWVSTVLKEKNLKNLSVNIVGNSEKGDGYFGDIVFVEASGTDITNKVKMFDLVLKCSKKSKTYREKSSAKEIFMNEIFVYNTILPYFTQFQIEKNIKDVFKSYPKCYGTVTGEDYEVIVLENLKNQGYGLWPKKNPVTRNHVNLVVKEYAKYHATSLAIQDQRPEEYKKLVNGLYDLFKRSERIETMFRNSLEEVAALMQNELDKIEYCKWISFKEQISEIWKNVDGVKVLVHGDCWNNNFMFTYSDTSKNLPEHVSILDWQLCRSASPVFDLSYFLFACSSEKDIFSIDEFLKMYYETLSNFLQKLGSDSTSVYPIEQFRKEWKRHCRFGILFGTFIMKICCTEKDEVVDLSEVAESGKNVVDSFNYRLKNHSNMITRLRPIIKYVTQNNLI